jgi:hypothetical protein
MIHRTGIIFVTCFESLFYFSHPFVTEYNLKKIIFCSLCLFFFEVILHAENDKMIVLKFINEGE